jgi:hypothetical protein
MGAGTKIISFVMFATFGTASGLAFNDYARRPIIKDVELITKSAETFGETIDFMDKLGDSYLTSETSKLPLTYALKRLEIVRQDNPDKTEPINKLISQIEAVSASEQILADPLLYRTAISGLETDLSDYADTNRNGRDLFAGGATAVCSLVGLGLIAIDIHYNS